MIYRMGVAKLVGMANPRKPREDDGDIGTVVVPKTKSKTQLKKPQLYKVLLHNDNYTTRDFVVFLLQTVFNKGESDAIQIMLHVHHNGIGVAGVYTREVAETKVETTIKLARQNEYPLLATMEPE